MRGLWPVAVAVVVRVAVWLLVSPSRLASDEDSYVRVGTALAATGQQDLFWPPVTGWLIALFFWLFDTDIRGIRLAWIAMDVGCVIAVCVLARRVGEVVVKDNRARVERFATLATLAYALYLPAISFSQFATSEVPALLLVLGVLVLLTNTRASWTHFAVAGLLTGTVAITRPSLLPLLVALPVAVVGVQRTRRSMLLSLVFLLAGVAVVGAVVARNDSIAGQPTIAQNSAYNLYIGNRDLYAEDLDLFHPVATAGQIEFRRQFWTGNLPYPTRSAEELQREALAWIAAHPTAFLRRALGRLARVFAPKTDVLELVGGERNAGIFSPKTLTLLAIANAQWIVVLFAGLAGLAGLYRLNPRIGSLFLAVVLGSLPLCLIAISKPRYAFGFEPLLLITAVLLCMAYRDVAAAMRLRDCWVVATCAAFLVWGWAAWIVFAITSRVALANAS